jgi:hypothetical protein
MATAAISVVRQLASQDAAKHQVLFERRDGGADEQRLIVVDRCRNARWQCGAQGGKPSLDLVGDRDAVLARLLLHDQRDRALPVQERRAAELLLAVDDLGDVFQAHHVAGAIGDRDRLEVLRLGDLAHRADRQFLRTLRNAARRQLDILLPQRRRHLGQRDVERPHRVGIEDDLDLAVGAADQLNLSDAAHALEPLLDLLVGDPGQVTEREIAADRDLQNRHGAGIELLDHWRFGGLGQPRRDERDAIADFLGGHIAILVEQEGDVDLRDALDRARAQLVDAADRVDGAFDLLGDLALDLLGRRTRVGHRHRDGWQIDVGHQIDAQPHERVEADDGQRHDEHRGKDRSSNAEFSQRTHNGYSLFGFRAPEASAVAVGMSVRMRAPSNR